MSDRHAFKAKWHDYNGGIYFVTICSAGKQHLFGHIKNARVYYSSLGMIVANCLTDIPSHQSGVEIWNQVVMPNHIHAVISVGAQYFAPASNEVTPAPKDAPTINTGCLRPSRHGELCADNHFNSRLAVIVRSYKAACTIEINRLMRAQNIAPLRQVWQRNYYEHIIRNQREYDLIAEYIDNNVLNWDKDKFHTLK